MTFDVCKALSLPAGSEAMVTFSGLHEILEPDRLVRYLFKQSFCALDKVYHPVTTSRQPNDDNNRGLLLRACSAEHSYLHNTLRNDPRHSLTMLYRGFSRFMLDDLASHSDAQNKSKNQRKRLSEKVALEMMHRNQAYSHLVELTMPGHVRLSIHAHNNAGPKFAVSLLPHRSFRSLTSFDDVRSATCGREYDEKHHLHIPTPWHNCLVQVKGEPWIYVCKAGVVKAELARPDSIWSPESGFRKDHPRGGRFVLHRGAQGSVVMPAYPEEEHVAAV
jgi:pyoverdine/dityrosine biosynthesis protein Dit1